MRFAFTPLFHHSPFIFFVVLFVFSACQPNTSIPYNDKAIQYEGRINQDTSAATLYWSGSAVKLNFTGTAVSAILSDETGNNYYNVILDNDTPFVLRPSQNKQTYLLASGLKNEAHQIELFKRTEWDRGSTRFYGFEITGTTLPKTPLTRSMVFYGNSITAGYAVEDFENRDRPDSSFTNCYNSYAGICARHYQASTQFICKSGIGITVSWFPLVMPELYDRLDPNNANSKWNFTQDSTQVVVINLLQNDSWIIEQPDNPNFKRVYSQQKPDKTTLLAAYQNFVLQLRNKHPQATIVCMLGNMDISAATSPWPELLQQTVAQLNDPKILSLVVPFKNSPNHPTIAEQQQLAAALIRFIDQNVNW